MNRKKFTETDSTLSARLDSILERPITMAYWSRAHREIT
jgi:hypothetical protein